MALHAQKYNPTEQPNTYQSTDNPNYWKNKMPFKGYWQQDVYYSIQANIDETTDIIDGVEKLVYQNNSPDTLREVFFHLYQNAFQPGSHYHTLHLDNDKDPHFGEYESQGKGTEIIELLYNQSKQKMVYNNTVLKVELDQPIAPNSSAEFDIVFKTYFDKGEIRRRMKKFTASNHTHYDGVHWYPRISVYDRKFGWTTDQHLGREFYGDFGCFDVELTFASNYVVEATGKLMNRSEVLPDSLFEKLKIENFKDKPWGEKATEIIPYNKEQRKTWKYHAENVHDFAFTADPTYRIGEVYWKGIRCVSLVREPHASKWQNAADYTAKIIKTFSEDFGMYQYNKMVVADAKDGMEYPMITLDGGKDPTYRGLLVHEVGHNWFYGQVGTNETYRAFMDEGFTQFLTAWGLEAIDGDTLAYTPYSKTYHKWFKEPRLAREARVYGPYIYDAMTQEDAPLNTHSDDFGSKLRHGGGYRHVYYKTAAMLYNLQYVLGDELFLRAMQHYFATWKIAHPYPEDFRATMIQYTGVDLNWFFDQWLETTKNIDYKVSKVKHIEGKVYEIHFKRLGDMQMPIDFAVENALGQQSNYHIPNTWFVKETDSEILPTWTGWSNFNRTYKAQIISDAKPKHIHIDPTNRLADVNLMNSHKPTMLNLNFDHRLKNDLSRTHYNLNVRPDIWYNAYDGIKLGVHLNGGYFHKMHNFSFTSWFNTQAFKDAGLSGIAAPNLLSYSFHYNTALPKIWRGAQLNFDSKFLDGLVYNKLGFSVPTKSKNTDLEVYIKSMYRTSIGATYIDQIFYPNAWSVEQWNNTLNVQFTHHYSFTKGIGKTEFLAKTSAFTNDFNYSFLRLNHTNSIGKKRLKFKSRVFLQAGFSDRWASESSLFLQGANPESMYENKYTRAAGLFYLLDVNPVMSLGGGLNARGYHNYFAAEQLDQNTTILGYASKGGGALNLELEYGNLLNKSKTLNLTPYLFADAALMQLTHPQTQKTMLSDLRADAGVGLAFSILKFKPLEKVKPLTLRVDFPFFVNRIPSTESDYIKFRWVVGINRAF